MPKDIADIFLCFEWGITLQEFEQMPEITINRFYEARTAKAEGEERKRIQEDNLAKLK